MQELKRYKNVIFEMKRENKRYRHYIYIYINELRIFKKYGTLR